MRGAVLVVLIDMKGTAAAAGTAMGAACGRNVGALPLVLLSFNQILSPSMAMSIRGSPPHTIHGVHTPCHSIHHGIAHTSEALPLPPRPD